MKGLPNGMKYTLPRIFTPRDVSINTIYCGPCEQVLETFPNNYFDLIYVDPPFGTGKRHEILWGNGYELRAFEDRWKGGINSFVSNMEAIVRACHRVLKETGTMYWHCDWHANAHYRILLDKIFEKNPQDEIIWSYTKVGGTEKKFLKWHETIFRYTKTDDFTFNMDEVREPYSKSLLKSLKKDDKGYYYTRGLGKDNNIKRKEKTYIHPKGKIPGDVWGIPYTLSQEEYLGYPTQKPEKLLEKIIRVSSNTGDLVLDPMCGGGTTIAVARRLGRCWIGIDVSPIACKLMVGRMRKMDVDINENDIVGLPREVTDLRSMAPFEFQKWICRRLWATPSRKKTKDRGIDGRLPSGGALQVKKVENVGRDTVDKFETAMRRAGTKEGIIVAFGFSVDAYDEAGRAKFEEGLKIRLMTVKELMNG